MLLSPLKNIFSLFKKRQPSLNVLSFTVQKKNDQKICLKTNCTTNMTRMIYIFNKNILLNKFRMVLRYGTSCGVYLWCHSFVDSLKSSGKKGGLTLFRLSLKIERTTCKYPGLIMIGDFIWLYERQNTDIIFMMIDHLC